MSDTARPGLRPALRPVAAWWRVGRWALAVLVAGALVVELAAGRRDLLRAAASVGDPRWPWLAAAVVADGASMVAYAAMQRSLLAGAGVRVGWGPATSLALAAHSLSITLPGGPVFSTAYNYRRMGALGADRAVASWAVAGSAALSAGALAALGAGAGVAAGASGDLGHLLLAVAVLVAVVGGARRLGARPAWTAALRRASSVVADRLRRRRAGPALARLRSAARRLLAVRVPASAWLAAGAGAAANWVLDAVCLFCACRATGLGGIGTEHLLLAYTAAMAASSFPVVPAGLGVVDAALTVGLVAAGADTGAALAADVLYRLVSLGLVGAAGWAAWGLQRARDATGRVRL